LEHDVIVSVLQLLSHTIYRKEPVTVVPTSSVEKSVIARFGDAFDEILPSSFDNLPHFAELVDNTTKKSIGSMGSEQQLLILLSRFIKLRYPSDVFGDSQESGSFRFLFIFSLTLKWSFVQNTQVQLLRSLNLSVSLFLPMGHLAILQ
jgi:hypothetical protein